MRLLHSSVTWGPSSLGLPGDLTGHRHPIIHHWMCLEAIICERSLVVILFVTSPRHPSSTYHNDSLSQVRLFGYLQPLGCSTQSYLETGLGWDHNQRSFGSQPVFENKSKVSCCASLAFRLGSTIRAPIWQQEAAHFN